MKNFVLVIDIQTKFMRSKSQRKIE